MATAPAIERRFSESGVEVGDFGRRNAHARMASTAAMMRYSTKAPVKSRSACGRARGMNITPSDQVQSAVTIAITGTITPNGPSALRGQNSATGTKAAAITAPDNHHQAKLPAPSVARVTAKPASKQYRTTRVFMMARLL